MSEPSQNNSEMPTDSAEASDSAVVVAGAAEQVIKIESHEESQAEPCHHHAGDEHKQLEDKPSVSETEWPSDDDHKQSEDHTSNTETEGSNGDEHKHLEDQPSNTETEESSGDKHKQLEHQPPVTETEASTGDKHKQADNQPLAAEIEEVTSTTKDHQPRSGRTARRPSYTSGRGYAGGYQNYGLTYLPYKSNFEPSEDARRKADEFFKTLKLQ